MFHPKVRALCAQITLEADQDKREALVTQLASVLGATAKGEQERAATKNGSGLFVSSCSSKVDQHTTPNAQHLAMYSTDYQVVPFGED